MSTSICAFSQFGLRLTASQNNYKTWDEITLASSAQREADLFKSSYEIGLDYWFRLKEIRVEFYPEVNYRLSSTNGLQNVDSGLPESYKLSSLGLGLNLHIYPFDLINDCDCPTFSKQSGALQKGFFLMLGAKENYQNKSVPNSPKHADFAFSVVGGFGFDIGVNDLLTISPFMNAQYFPSTQWEGFNALHGIVNVLPPDESTSNIAFQIGIRLGFRPDYLANN